MAGKIVRSGYQARMWFRNLSRKRARRMPPDNITVLGHCVGSVGRAFTDGPAGFYDAHTMIAACRRAGVLRSGKPPKDAIALYSGGKHGHACLVGTQDRVWTVDLPDMGYIGRVPRAMIVSRWRYRYEGYVKAKDVPGWRA